MDNNSLWNSINFDQPQPKYYFQILDDKNALERNNLLVILPHDLHKCINVFIIDTFCHNSTFHIIVQHLMRFYNLSAWWWVARARPRDLVFGSDDFQISRTIFFELKLNTHQNFSFCLIFKNFELDCLGDQGLSKIFF